MWQKFVAEKSAVGIFQLLSTTAWKAILNIFIANEDIAVQTKCCFR